MNLNVCTYVHACITLLQAMLGCLPNDPNELNSSPQTADKGWAICVHDFGTAYTIS